MRPLRDRRWVLPSITLILLAVLVGSAEQYRARLASSADQQEEAARQLEQEVKNLRSLERRLQPDAELVTRVEGALLLRTGGNLSQQLVERVLADGHEAGVNVTRFSAPVPRASGKQEAIVLTLQLEGSSEQVRSYLKRVEEGDALARVATLSLNEEGGEFQLEPAEKAGHFTVHLTVPYYIRAP